MRAPLSCLACAALLAGCGGGDERRPAAPAPAPSATAAAPAPSATVTGSGPKAAVRRAVVAFYDAQGRRDGEATCALMTPAARRFYAEGFGGGRVSCQELFGPDGARLFSVGAPYSSGIFKAATVAIAGGGTRAVAKALDETITLERVRGRWLVTEP